MKNTSPNDPERRSERSRARTVKILCFVLCGLFVVATGACVVAYAVTKLDVLFIPIALCAVAAMISFTYGRVSRGE